MSEDEFEKFFHQKKLDDPEEYARRKEALEKHEKNIHDTNEKFMKGEISWFDRVNKLSNLPDDEFVKDHTGLRSDANSSTRGRGLINPSPDELEDPASERYFDSIRMNRIKVPSSYSAVEAGNNKSMYVDPLKIVNILQTFP